MSSVSSSPSLSTLFKRVPTERSLSTLLTRNKAYGVQLISEADRTITELTPSESMFFGKIDSQFTKTGEAFHLWKDSISDNFFFGTMENNKVTGLAQVYSKLKIGTREILFHAIGKVRVGQLSETADNHLAVTIADKSSYLRFKVGINEKDVLKIKQYFEDIKNSFIQFIETSNMGSLHPFLDRESIEKKIIDIDTFDFFTTEYKYNIESKYRDTLHIQERLIRAKVLYRKK